jgi:hypothetical protein
MEKLFAESGCAIPVIKTLFLTGAQFIPLKNAEAEEFAIKP